MTQVTSPEETDTTIRDLHRIREMLSDKFHGDIAAILADARERQQNSGCVIRSRDPRLDANPEQIQASGS